MTPGLATAVDLVGVFTLGLSVVLALLSVASLVAAVFAAKYARESARAASDSVAPLQATAAGIDRSVTALQALQEGDRELLAAMSSAAAAERTALQVDAQRRRLALLREVLAAMARVDEGLRRFHANMPSEYLVEAQRELAVALIMTKGEGLPETLASASELGRTPGEIASALTSRAQVEQKIAEISAGLDAILLAAAVARPV